MSYAFAPPAAPPWAAKRPHVCYNTLIFHISRGHCHMQDSRTCALWTAVVFMAAFAFYALTAAFVPVPGASAAFASALCFPGSAPAVMEYPLDAVLGRAVATLAGPGHMMAALAALAALLGALAVTGLFRATVAGVRFSCLDLTGIREAELPRVIADVSATAILAGLGAALAGAVSLPLWALGTRPLPGALSAVLGVALLTFAMGVRWRAAANPMTAPSPNALFPRVLMGAVFGFAAFLGTTAPTLVPVAALGIVLAGGPLIDRDTENRLAFTPWIALGLLVGVALSVLSVWLWHEMFGAGAEAGPLSLWGRWMQGALPELQRLFLSFGGVAPLALFALGAALLLGCFPTAYLRFGTPFVGQLATLALAVAMALRWPGELWDGMSEPSALGAVGVAVATVAFGLTVGSWARNWLDVHTHWPRARAHAMAALFVSMPALALALALIHANAADGSGAAAQRALRGAWEETDAALPKEAAVWWAPPPDATGLLMRRAATGAPIRPMSVNGRPMGSSALPAALAERLAGDPVADALATVGQEALRLYLAHTPATAQAFLEGPLPDTVAETFGAVADALETTAFGATPLGVRTVRTLRAEAARAAVNQAAEAAPREAIALLRRALALDPGNPAAALGLEALERRTPDPNNPSAALLALERHPWLREPPPARARAFEAAYGHVRTPAFDSARRLWALSHTDREAALADILALDPARLSRQERLLALLNLSEDAAGARLEAGDPTTDELEAYLCAYPKTARAKALFAKHREALRKHGALAQLYGGKGRTAGRRAADKMLSFFLRDGRFAYALFHVNDLLREGAAEEAAAFVSGFNMAERLGACPALAEALRARVLRVLILKEPQAALETARAWLQADPWQPSLWTLLLTNPAQPDGAAADARRCLAFLPLHPEATRRFAECLRSAHGDAAANRYLEAIGCAREALTAKEPHAHR